MGKDCKCFSPLVDEFFQAARRNKPRVGSNQGMILSLQLRITVWPCSSTRDLPAKLRGTHVVWRK